DRLLRVRAHSRVDTTLYDVLRAVALALRAVEALAARRDRAAEHLEARIGDRIDSAVRNHAAVHAAHLHARRDRVLAGTDRTVDVVDLSPLHDVGLRLEIAGE